MPELEVIAFYTDLAVRKTLYTPLTGGWTSLAAHKPRHNEGQAESGDGRSTWNLSQRA